jgi:hypothetical protein
VVRGAAIGDELELREIRPHSIAASDISVRLPAG